MLCYIGYTNEVCSVFPMRRSWAVLRRLPLHGCRHEPMRLPRQRRQDLRYADLRPHAFEVALNVHYCPGHAIMWRKFVDAGGVERELKNLVPFAAKEQT